MQVLTICTLNLPSSHHLEDRALWTSFDQRLLVFSFLSASCLDYHLRWLVPSCHQQDIRERFQRFLCAPLPITHFALPREPLSGVVIYTSSNITSANINSLFNLKKNRIFARLTQQRSVSTCLECASGAGAHSPHLHLIHLYENLDLTLRLPIVAKGDRNSSWLSNSFKPVVSVLTGTASGRPLPSRILPVSPATPSWQH